MSTGATDKLAHALLLRFVLDDRHVDVGVDDARNKAVIALHF